MWISENQRSSWEHHLKKPLSNFVVSKKKSQDICEVDTSPIFPAWDFLYFDKTCSFPSRVPWCPHSWQVKPYKNVWIVVGRIVIGNSFHYAFTWRMDEKRYYWVTWYGCFNFLRELFFCEHLLLTFWCFLLAIMTSPMTSAMGSRLWEDSQVDQAPKRWKLQYLVEGGAKLLGECENKALFYCNLVWSNVRLGQQVWQKSMIL